MLGTELSDLARVETVPVNSQSYILGCVTEMWSHSLARSLVHSMATNGTTRKLVVPIVVVGWMFIWNNQTHYRNPNTDIQN